MFNKIKLRKNISKEINEMIRLEFDYFIEKKILEKIYRKINEKTKEMFSNNHFLYLNMDDTVCTHIFKRGRREGYFCQKKIRTNIEDNSKDYLCTKHSKKHVPKKRLKKNEVEDKFIIPKINSKTKNNIYINNKNKIFKNKLKNRFKNKIIVHGEINFKNIIERLVKTV